MRSVIKTGGITGLVSGIWAISSYTVVGWLNRGLHLNIPATQIRAYSGLFSMVILLTGIYLGMQAVKRKNGARISYGAAVKAGIVISIITGILLALFSLLYCAVINPGYTELMAKETASTLVAAHAAPAEIDRQVAAARKEFSAASQAVMALVGQTVVGIIGSLIIGLFIRTKKQAI